MTTFFTKSEFAEFVNKRSAFVDCNIKNKKMSLYNFKKYATVDDKRYTNSKGLLYNGDLLAAVGFPFTPRYTPEKDFPQLEKELDLQKYRIFDSYEGTVLYLKYIDNGWNIHTSKKINAFYSRWVDPLSFGKIFETSILHEYEDNPDFKSLVGDDVKDNGVFKAFLETLDKKLEYAFIVKSFRDNVVLCSCDKQREASVFLGVFDGEFKFTPSVNLDYPFLKPTERVIDNLPDLMDYVEDCDINKIQGVVLFDESTGEFIKIINGFYKYVQDIRGKSTRLTLSYIKSRRNKKDNSLLRKYFPNHELYSSIDREINRLALDIKESYIKRYIQRQNIVLDQFVYKIMESIHSLYIDYRKQQKEGDNKKTFYITKELVTDTINNWDAFKICKIIEGRFRENEPKAVQTTFNSPDEFPPLK
jgi:hypothetical protein